MAFLSQASDASTRSTGRNPPMSMEAVARGCLAPAVLIVLLVAACCLAALPCQAGRARAGPETARWTRPAGAGPAQGTGALQRNQRHGHPGGPRTHSRAALGFGHRPAGPARGVGEAAGRHRAHGPAQRGPCLHRAAGKGFERRNHGATTRWEQGSFAAALQGALGKALCGSPLTRPGAYRAALQLWIGPVGVVEHSRLLGPTGDLQRDAALVEACGA